MGKFNLESKVKKGKEVEGEKYRDYFKFSTLAKRIPSHRLLAILRAEKEKVLSVSLSISNREILLKLSGTLDSSAIFKSFILPSYPNSILPLETSLALLKR